MKDDDLIISGFDSNVDGKIPVAVDFASARKLDRSGSTCDAYECVVQRRRVFVKRLKSEYRENPLYRAAFDKEFDIGVTLSHPSLPRYIFFGGDHIVMDFIEGDTLAELIKRGDSRLKSRKFVRRLLCELIDAVDYLHNRNIVHCDIKADNIIISPYADRPITLLDLDKAYSPWLDSTHGNAAKYGCDSCSDGAIDFKGVGLIARKLGMKRMAKACNRAGVSADFLRQQLADRSPGWLITALVVAIVLGTSVAVMLWYGAPTENKTAPAASDSIIATDTLPESVPAENLPKSAIDTAWIASVIAEHLGNDDEYRMKLLAMLDCDTIPNREKADSINAYQLNYLAAVSKIINTAVTHYGDISESDVQKAVRNHPEWLRLEKEQEKMLIRLQKLYEVKGAQRLSVRPASQPDTLQGDILPAPRH